VFESARRVAGRRATLGVADMRLLWLATERRSVTLRDVAERLRLEQSTVNRQVNAALAAGLLDRETDDDTGAYRFSASRAGEAEFEKNLHIAFGPLGAALAELGDGRETFIELGRTFVDAYRRAVADDDARGS
jgi:predicted transcriptional regulator